MDRAKRLALALALTASVSVKDSLAGTLTLAWDPNPEPDIAGYLLSYGTSPGVHTTTVDVGNRTTYQVSNLAAGSRYYFVVRAYNTRGVVSEPSSEVSGQPIGITALVPNQPPPVTAGSTVIWTALGSEGVALEYQFWRFSQSSGTWTIVRDYAQDNTYTWTPSESEVGTYALQVWARPTGSSERYEAWQGSGFFSVVRKSLRVLALEADAPLPAATGTPITWTARVAGAGGPVLYRFYRFSQASNTWSLVRDYSVSNTYTWTPGPNDAGRYALQVWVKHSDSGLPYEGWRSSGFFDIQDGPVRVASLSPDVSFPVGTGTPISWNAVAAGGPGPLEYQFWRFSRATGTWTMVRDYGPSPTYVWTPSSNEQGTYALQVWVRRQGLTTPYEAWAASGFFTIADSLPRVTVLSPDRGAPFEVGTPLTWTADASGGPGPLEFRFWLFNAANQTWSILREYSTSKVVTWTPVMPGAYAIMVGVRRSGSSSYYEAYATESFVVSDQGSAPVVREVVSSANQDVAAGTPIRWTARVAGGPALLEFRFYLFSHATQRWTLAQDYSSDPTFDWVPLPGQEGTYTTMVWVRRVGSEASYESHQQAAPVTVR